MEGFEKIVAKMTGSIVCNNDVHTMRSGETRLGFTVKKGFASVRVGTKVDWLSGMILRLTIIKNIDDTFYNDDTQGENETSTEKEEKERSSESDPVNLFVLAREIQPPYLVPRPDVFPCPKITISNFEVQGLQSRFLVRPINPFAVFRILNKVDVEQEFRTSIQFNERDPKWNEHVLFQVPNTDCCLQIKIMDRKPVKNRILAELLIPLGSVELSMSEPISRQFTVNLHQKPEHTCQITFMLQYENLELWWIVEEIKARDAQKEQAGVLAEVDARNQSSSSSCSVM